MSDRNNQNNFDSEEIRRWIQQNPELLAKAKQSNKKRTEAHSIVSDGYLKKPGQILKDLFTVNPKQLHGDAFTNREIESHSNAVATVGTVANTINIVTAFPLIFFAMADIPLLGFPLALGISLGLLKFSNTTVEIAAANKPGNKFWSDVGLAGVITLNIVQSVVSGVGTQLMLDKPGISNRFAEELVYTQVIKSKEAKVEEASKFDPSIIESKQKCEELEAELANTPSNTDKSRRLYQQAYGSYQDSLLPPEQRSYNGLPIHQLPHCIADKEKEKRATEKLATAESELQESKAKIAENSSLIYLKQQKPDVYQQHFDDKEELKSGMTSVKLSTEMFFEKISNGDWTALGLTLYIFALSIITSAIAVLLVASHSRRVDIQMSRSNAVKRARDIELAKRRAELFNQLASRESTRSDISYSSNGNGKHH